MMRKILIPTNSLTNQKRNLFILFGSYFELCFSDKKRRKKEKKRRRKHSEDTDYVEGDKGAEPPGPESMSSVKVYFFNYTSFQSLLPELF